MSGEGGQGKTAAPLTREQKALLLGVAVPILLVWMVSLGTPIPSGRKNREKAGPFLKEQFPDRTVSPRDSVTAPVAVVYHLIRSGEPAVARRAIAFASEQRFGYAAPYVIERLGSGDPELERAAQNYLRTIAGGDYGPDAESWRAWWRDPPRHFPCVVPVGRNTFAIAVPATLALAGVLLLAIGRAVRRTAVADKGVPLLLVSWFMGCVLIMMRLVGSSQTCIFGSSQITYYAEHGTVVGLEGARAGGMGLMVLLSGGYMLGGLALMVACAAFILRLPKEAGTPADRAGAS
jgi:hypothetical protein